MKEKQHDYFLNLLNNPTFSPIDFNAVGLSVDNTSLLSRNDYLNSSYIKEQDIFKDKNGNFDESRFDDFYKVAKLGYQGLTEIKTAEQIGDTWKFYKGNLLAPEELREKRPEYKIQKTQNPLRQQEGFVNFGLKEEPTQSVREIAQTQLVYDPETGKYLDSPNESWWDNFWNPKVYAQWDADGTHIDPITGQQTEHKKGDYILNENGTYYTETLGDRNIYGRQVLSGFDTLTTDGSGWNKLDFFDSDDIEKSTGGSLMRAVAQIAPAFGPTAPYYIGARILISLGELIPTIGKIFAGSNNELFSQMEALNKTFSFSSSDYVNGSNELEMQAHPWSAENGLKLISDVFTQLAEQRWIFKYGTALFSGMNPKMVGSTKEAVAEQEKWIENYINKKLNNEALIKELSASGIGGAALEAELKIRGHQLAQNVLKKSFEQGQKMASNLSIAYMTGVTTASAYGEAKEEGLSDIEAALFTLGYTAGEYALLKSDLGQWILPELKQERRYFKAMAKAALGEEAKKGAEKAEEEAFKKLSRFRKIFELGKKAYHGELNEVQGLKKVLGETAGMTLSNMTSEALEESSEELLQDFSKALFNAAASLGGSEHRLKTFENAFDRYALSFIGGAIGGGIAGTLPGYRAARANSNMTQEQAIRGIVDIVQEGKDKEFLETAYKATLDNKFLSPNINDDGTTIEVDDELRSRDAEAKKRLTEVVYNIKDILTANGADMSSGELMKSLRGDMKYAQLASLAQEKGNVISYYINRYNDLSTQLVQEVQSLHSLENPPLTDKQKRENKDSEGNQKVDETTKNQIKESKERIKKIKDELDAYRDGRMSDEFLQDALFEMTTGISSAYFDTDWERYAEKIEKKPFSEISNERKLQLKAEFDNMEHSRRELIHMARKVHIRNQEWLSQMMQDFHEEYFKNRDAAIKNFEEIFFGHIDILNQVEQPEMYQQFIKVSPNAMNAILHMVQRNLLIGMNNNEELKKKMEEAVQLPDSVSKLLGLQQMPSFEEFKNVFGSINQEAFNQFLELAGEDEQYAEEFDINNYTEQEYVGQLKTANKALQKAQAQQFNTQLFEFLNNPEVQEEIVKKLKNAQYLLPTTKEALTEFFNSKLEIQDEFGETEVVELNPDTKKKYLDALEGIPSSPVDIYLNNIVSTLKSNGINISGLSTSVGNLLFSLARAGNIESFNYDKNVEEQINAALDLIKLAVIGLESAKTTIKGDLTDLFGFNATINEIRDKRGTKTRKSKGESTTSIETEVGDIIDSEPIELALIPDDIAAGIQKDLAKYAKELEMYKKIYAANSKTVLATHDNTLKNYALTLNRKLNSFIGTVDIKDWEGIEELKQELANEEITKVFSEIQDNKDIVINDELKERITRAEQLQDKALYNFFQKNESKINNRESLAKLLKSLKASKVVSTISENMEEGISDRDFIWHLAEVAAVNPDSVAYEFKESIDSQYAPLLGQEKAIKRAYSFLINPKIFENFAKAHNLNLDPNDDGTLSVDSFRSIFIEGVPGSGKSSAVLKVLMNMLNQFHPQALKNVVFVSNSKENADRTASNLGLENVTTMSKAEYMEKISNNYKYTENKDDSGNVIGINGYNNDGSMQIVADDIKNIEEDGENRVIYANTTVNPEGLSPSLVIIDEATSLSQADAALHEDFLKAKGIYSILAGDFDQLGAKGTYEKEIDGKKVPITVSQNATNYITTQKLGQVIRSENESKSNDILKLLNRKKDFILSLIDPNIDSSDIEFSYYFDESGLYGDYIAQADYTRDGTGNLVLGVDEPTKQMISTLIQKIQKENSGEKLNYIYDDESSPLYEYLKSLPEWGTLIKPITAGASQSQEGDYYIVDLDIHKTGIDAKNQREAEDMFAKLYTAISRAKQGTIIFDREGNTGTISNRIQSIKADRLVKKELSGEAIVQYGRTRKEHITKAIPEKVDKTKLQWNPNSTSTNTPDTDSNDKENDSGDEDENNDQDIDIKNQRTYTPNVDTEDPDKMNTMLHTVMCQETGCEVTNPDLDPTDPNNELILGHKKRIDSVNGLVNIPTSGVKAVDGKVSGKSKEKALNILGTIRSAATYKKTKAEMINSIATALGLNPEDIDTNFIFKSSWELDTIDDSQGNFLKWAKGKLEKLLGIFSKDKNSSSYQPRRQTFSLEIFVKENGQFKQKLEVPIAILTSPTTLLQTKGYEELNSIFEECKKADRNHTMSLFKTRLKNMIDNKEIVPHIYDMYNLVRIYTTYKNFVVRFDKDFMLNRDATLSGILLPKKNRGEQSAVFTDEYTADGENISLEEYKKRMSWRSFSTILENSRDNILDKDGNIAIKKGSPFILMSDVKMNDQQLFNQYIKQLNDPNEPKLVTRVYLYLPKGTVEDFLFNMETAFKNINDEEDENAVQIDKDLGNQMSAYRLLQFIAKDGSNFDSEFNNWIDNGQYQQSQKDDSHNKWKKLKQLMSVLEDYESNLTPKSGKSVSKQMQELLDKKVEDLKSNKNIYDALPEFLKARPKNTLRTLLQYELRKLLYSSAAYGPSLKSQIQDIRLTRKDGKVEFQEYQKPRIEALIKDLPSNWEGILYHTTLANTSEDLQTSYNGNTYRLAKVNAEDDTKISQRSFELNGKTDTSTIILDSKPLIDFIIENATWSENNGRNIESFTEKDKQKHWKNHTQAYLNGVYPETKELTEVEKFNNGLNNILGDVPKSALKLIQLKEGDTVPTNIREYIREKLNGTQYVLFMDNSIRKIKSPIQYRESIGEMEIIVSDNKLFEVANNQIVEVKSVDGFNWILNNGSDALKTIAQQKLDVLNNPPSIFGFQEFGDKDFDTVLGNPKKTELSEMNIVSANQDGALSINPYQAALNYIVGYYNGIDGILDLEGQIVTNENELQTILTELNIVSPADLEDFINNISSHIESALKQEDPNCIVNLK